MPNNNCSNHLYFSDVDLESKIGIYLETIFTKQIIIVEWYILVKYNLSKNDKVSVAILYILPNIDWVVSPKVQYVMVILVFKYFCLFNNIYMWIEEALMKEQANDLIY